MPRARHWQLDPYFRTKASGIATEEECQLRTRAGGATCATKGTLGFRCDPRLYRFHAPLFFECGVPMYGNSFRMSVWGLRPVGGH